MVLFLHLTCCSWVLHKCSLVPHVLTGKHAPGSSGRLRPTWLDNIEGHHKRKKSLQESCAPLVFASRRRRGLLFRRFYAWRGPLADLFYVLLARPAVPQAGTLEHFQALAEQGD